MSKPVWVVAHLAALVMLFVGGWVTIAGFVLFTAMPSRRQRRTSTSNA
jgi:hypothetical protein